MLPLMKVPFILAFMTGTWVSYTPPQPPPEENEKMEWTVVEAVVRRRYILFTIKVS